MIRRRNFTQGLLGTGHLAVELLKLRLGFPAVR
jgi:hypothetical protein